MDPISPEKKPSCVYCLGHIYEFDKYEDDEGRILGYYSTRAKAEAAMARFMNEPGFRETPDGFTIDEHPLDKVKGWETGFITCNWTRPDKDEDGA